MNTTPRIFTILGSGTSVGVPVIGCDCIVCTSTDPKENRTRSSSLIRLEDGKHILIDTSPELRIQLIREKISLIHAVLYTHYHADHLFGLDDVRLFPRRLGGPLPIYCTDEVEEVIREAFSYAFHPPGNLHPALILPQLQFQRIDTTPFEILQLPVIPIPLIHGRFTTYGYRFGDLAYCTDVNAIPESSWPLLQNLDTLILDAVRPGPSLPSHFGLDEAMGVIDRLAPKHTYLTHLSHYMDPRQLSLPAHVSLAYDGLQIPF